MDSLNLKELLTVVDNRIMVDRVEMKMLDFFLTRDLKPGDLIPKEVQLAEVMGVSRTVIRESLNRLKTMDIIESKKHKGTIIKSPDLFKILQKSMIPNILNNSTLRDIFELRLILEVGMADLVFHRITNKDIDDLFELVRDEPDKSNSIRFDVDYEIKFHGKLYEITRNKSLKQFQFLLLHIFNYAYISGLINQPTKKKKFVSHKGLVEVLRNGDAEKFRVAMRAHLENHFSRILDRV